MPRKKTKKAATKKTATKKAATTPPPPKGLQPKSPGGRALLAMVRIFLEADVDVWDRSVVPTEFVRGFLARRTSLDFVDVGELQEDVVRLLLEYHDGKDDDEARGEAERLAERLVHR